MCLYCKRQLSSAKKITAPSRLILLSYDGESGLPTGFIPLICVPKHDRVRDSVFFDNDLGDDG